MEGSFGVVQRKFLTTDAALNENDDEKQFGKETMRSLRSLRIVTVCRPFLRMTGRSLPGQGWLEP